MKGKRVHYKLLIHYHHPDLTSTEKGLFFTKANVKGKLWEILCPKVRERNGSYKGTFRQKSGELYSVPLALTASYAFLIRLTQHVDHCLLKCPIFPMHCIGDPGHLM